jgi:hypothetical protein
MSTSIDVWTFEVRYDEVGGRESNRGNEMRQYGYSEARARIDGRPVTKQHSGSLAESDKSVEHL